MLIRELFIFPVRAEISEKNSHDCAHAVTEESVINSGRRNEFLECDRVLRAIFWCNLYFVSNFDDAVSVTGV